jgi:HEAT repeat protein
VSEATDAVGWLLAQAEPEARRVAVQQIVKVHGREAAELLVRALGDDDWRVRKEATKIAHVISARDEVVAALVGALEERNNIGLRNAAVEALAAIGRDALPSTIEALAKLDADGRKLAVEVIRALPDLRAAQALVRALDDDDPNVRVAAAEALGSVAPAGEDARALAEEALAGVLGAGDMLLKLAALDSLTRLEARLPWSFYAPHAKDPLLRRHAIVAAAGSSDAEAIAEVAAATADASATIAREAIVSLGECVAASPDAVTLDLARGLLRAQPAAHGRVRDLASGAADGRARGAAMLVLGLLADDADVPLLVEALEDDDVAPRAEQALGLFGASVIDPLIQASRDAHPARRAAILALVASLGASRARPGPETFREALTDPSPDVVAAAARGLGAAGDASDLARLVGFVANGDGRIAATAAAAVTAIASRHPDEARRLRDAIDPRGDDGGVGCALVSAMAQTGVATTADLVFAQSALANADPRVRRAAVDALAATGADEAAESIEFALADEERDVQLAAVRALGRIGREAPLVDVVRVARDASLVAAALRALGAANAGLTLASARPLVVHADAAVASAAVEAIGRLPPSPDRDDALFAALDHGDAEVVKMALSELAVVRDARILARFGLCLDHASWEVRRVAAELLGQDASPAAEALLRARYERERDPLVREAIQDAVSIRSGAELVRTLTAPPLARRYDER